jgi:alpha-beta hydrolase superfamily lysophospholipase
MFQKILITSLACLLIQAAQADIVNLKGKDGFKIYGDFVAGKSASNNSSITKGVLMLHQCNADRSMYEGLAKQLSSSGISSMSLDFRGFGDSKVNGQSISDIRAKAKSRKHYFEMLDELGIGGHRPDDVEIAYQHLKMNLATDASISIIGASCGGTQAVLLAQKHRPDSFIFFSSAMNDETRELFNKMSDIPALFIAAQEDGNTFTSLSKAFLDAKSNDTRLVSYKGSGHGIPLFKQDRTLQSTMVEWFKGNDLKDK